MKGTKVLVTFLILVVIGVLWLAYFMFMLSPIVGGGDVNSEQLVASSTIVIPQPGSLKPFVIKRGHGFGEIATALEEMELIRSAKFFKFYALVSGKADKLKPGLYEISPVMSSQEIINLLVFGPGVEVTVLVREGETLAQVDKRLAEFGVIDEGELENLSLTKAILNGETSVSAKISLKERYEFLFHSKNLEGFLFPDTYRFFFDSSPAEVALVFLDNFEKKVGSIIPDEKPIHWNTIPVVRRGIFTIKEILTIASMIEKEVPDSAERKIIADVIYKRLKINMPLQIDATRDYLNSGSDDYDTYKFFGLPPGPIANPGLDAIDATLNPKASPYWYYLSNSKTRETIFAKTFEDHKANQLIHFK